MNPYGIAPLTAVIKNGGYYVTNAKVTILPKQGDAASVQEYNPSSD